MIDVDNAVFQVNIRNRQPYKFRNPKSCLKKDIDTFIVSGKVFILFYEFQKCPFLLSGKGFSCHTVIDNYRGKLELKGIFPYQIIINRHLERWSYNATHRMYGAVPSAVTLQFNQPAFCVR